MKKIDAPGAVATGDVAIDTPEEEFAGLKRALTGVEPLLDWRLAAGTLLFGLGFWGWERRHANPLSNDVVRLAVSQHKYVFGIGCR
jgi:hypothetical protein